MRKINASIRCIEEKDAENWLALLKKLASETDFMLSTLVDREFNVEKCKRHINHIRGEQKSEILVLEDNHKNIVGYILGEIPPFVKKSHIMTFVGGVIKEYQYGYGRSLIQTLILLAKERGIKRVELSVLSNNKVCINMCLKLGFEIEGKKISALKIETRYEDEIIMGILL